MSRSPARFNPGAASTILAESLSAERAALARLTSAKIGNE
ncbi:Uncharacterised protein [Vibrio cholerae]|nr:Uncharacterised protein [Vibrio cholerae]